MMRRAAIMVAVALVALTLLRIDAASTSNPTPAPLSAHPSLSGATAGSTWYCPAAGATTPAPLAHHVLITNADRHNLNARLTSYLAMK